MLIKYVGSVTQSCPTLCDPRTVVHRDLCPWNFSGRNTGAGCHFLLQGIFPTQGSNLCFLRGLHSGGFFTTMSPGKPILKNRLWQLIHLLIPLPVLNTRLLDLRVLTAFSTTSLLQLQYTATA